MRAWALLPLLLLTACPLGAEEKSPAVVTSEFIFEKADFRQCHASTIVETGSGLVVAWFGGTREGTPDVGIWLSRKDKDGWTKPVEVAKGLADGKQYPCWNPVLFQPSKGPLQLYYKVGPSPSRWWGMLITSEDGGKTWSRPIRLPDGILGPIKNKPAQLGDATLLSGSSTEDKGWRVFMELSPDLGKTWKSVGPLNDGKTLAAIQPALLVHSPGKIQILCRTKQKFIAESWSQDGGKTWSELTLTKLPNPNSGIDAVTIKDGRHVLIYNHTPSGRSPLNVAISKDGKTWQAALTLETERGEYSYPAVIQTSDGLLHFTYTWKRLKVKHVVADPTRLKLREIINGKWPE